MKLRDFGLLTDENLVGGVDHHFRAGSISKWRWERWMQASNSSKKLTWPNSSGTFSARVQAKTRVTGVRFSTRAWTSIARAS